MPTSSKSRTWIRALSAVFLAALFLFSIYLAMTRIYQVDEAQNIFMARVVGMRQSGSFFTTAALWFLGPLAWLARSAQASSQLFDSARVIGLAMFWVNILLIGLNSGLRLRSTRGLLALLMAATLAPLWDYGFEFRHDNLILMGLLFSWWIGRNRTSGRAWHFLLGFLAVVLQFIAFKAFVFVLPLTVLLFIFGPGARDHGRVRLAAFWIAGALSALILCRVAYHFSGLWPVYLAGLHGGMEASAAGSRFGPGATLERLLSQTPLLLAITFAALLSLGQDLRSRGLAALASEGTAPEALFFLAMLGAILVNPTPFPYNLVNLVPMAFLLCLRYLGPALQDLPKRPAILALAGGILCFTHGVPFVTATWRHLDWRNDRQVLLMRAAEELTDPLQDKVYDAIGMVPTRQSIHFHWYLHSLNIQGFLDGTLPSVRQMVEANPPAVIIPSYRTDWLREEDWKFIRTRYLPLADDFLVLGQVLPPGGGAWDIVHSGRYLALQPGPGGVHTLDGGSLDGAPCGPRPIRLEKGRHLLSCPATVQPIVIWVGPSLEQVPTLGPGDHRRLFANWY